MPWTESQSPKIFRLRATTTQVTLQQSVAYPMRGWGEGGADLCRLADAVLDGPRL